MYFLDHCELVRLIEVLTGKKLEGVCNGFTVVLSQALLAQKEEEFFSKIELIETYKGDFDSLKNAVNAVKQKEQKHQKLNDKEKRLLDFSKWIADLLLAQESYKYPEKFNNRILSQSSLEVYPHIESIKLENSKHPISIMYHSTHLFDAQNIVSYLQDLEKILINTGPTPIILHTSKHALLISYDKKNKRWMFADSNAISLVNPTEIMQDKKIASLLEQINASKGGVETIARLTAQLEQDIGKSVKFYSQTLNADDLGDGYLLRYGDPKSNSLICTVTAISTDSSQINAFQQLRSKYPIVPENISVYEQEQLLSNAAVNNDIETVNNLIKHDPGLVNPRIFGNLLCFSDRVELVKALLSSSKINVNHIVKRDNSDEGKKKITFLGLATRSGHIANVRALLEHKDIDINAGNPNPLRIACIVGNKEMIEILVRDSKIDVSTVLTEYHKAQRDSNNIVMNALSLHPAVQKIEQEIQERHRQSQITNQQVPIKPTSHIPANNYLIPKTGLRRSYKPSRALTLGIPILGGFIAVLGCAAVALAFTVLNAATLGVGGLVVAGLGVAAILGGFGLFALGMSKNQKPSAASSSRNQFTPQEISSILY